MPSFSGLWRNPQFVKLWAGQTISHVGSQVSALALPLTAVLTLQASPAEMGLLGAAEVLPWMLVGLFAGVWVDRLPRRPILVATDLGRAVLLLVVPVAAVLGMLNMPLLYVVAFLVGVLGVFFEVANNAILPSLVKRNELVDGNSKLIVSASAAEIVGPGLAGTLVQLITAPVAIAVDVVSYLISAIFVGTIRVQEPRVPVKEGRNVMREVREGLALLLKNPVLRTLAFASASANLVFAMQGALRVLFASRDLHLEPSVLGLVFALGSVGALPAALLAGRASRRFGIGPTIVSTMVLLGLGGICFALAGGPLLVTLSMLVLGLSLTGLGAFTYMITVGSLRQSITPLRLQGRIAASARFVSRSASPIGSIVGGLLGEWLGLRLTLALAGVVCLLVAIYLRFSPVAPLREAPAAHDETAVQTDAAPVA